MNSKYIKESARQIRFEIDIIKNLELNNFTDKTLEKYIQDHLNHFYGLETVGFFKKRKIPIKYCIINTIRKANSAIEKDRQRKIFWSDEYTNTDIERQWVRDMEYLKKYKTKYGSIDWDRMDIDKFLFTKRNEDRKIINKEANIFITTRKKYVHFRNKYKNYLDYCENLIDDSFYFDTQPSAPPLEKF